MWVPPHVLKVTIYFVGSGGQLSQVFDLRPFWEWNTGLLFQVYPQAVVALPHECTLLELTIV